MWVGSNALEYVNYITWDPEQSKKCLFAILTFKLALKNLGGVMLPTLCT